MSSICRRLQDEGSVSLDDFTEAERAWLTGAFAKVYCRVDSEEELLEIHGKALKVVLEVHLIPDSGKTGFHSEPTNTCLAVGSDEAEKIDTVTGHLKLSISNCCEESVEQIEIERRDDLLPPRTLKQ